MALFKQVPGQSSPLTLLTSSFVTIVTLLILISGHVSLGIILWFNYQGEDGLALTQAFTHLDKQALYINIGLAILLDAWIIISKKRPQKTINK